MLRTPTGKIIDPTQVKAVCILCGSYDDELVLCGHCRHALCGGCHRWLRKPSGDIALCPRAFESTRITWICGTRRRKGGPGSGGTELKAKIPPFNVEAAAYEKGDYSRGMARTSFRCRELLNELKPSNCKEIQLYLNIATSPTASGRVDALLRAERLLEKAAFYQRTHPPEAKWPVFDEFGSIKFGQGFVDRMDIRILLSILARHLSVYGPTGSGKTTFLFTFLPNCSKPVSAWFSGL
jgi:hypothetical protein